MTVNINEDGKRELSDVTLEILNLTNNLKEKTKNSMMIGEANIIRGIVAFEETVKEINPEELNDDAIYMIMSCIRVVLFKEEERKQHVDNYVHYGVNSCFMALDIYNKSIKRREHEK